MVSEAEMQALVGHEFPGGKYTIAHWENFLLTEATGGDQLPEGLAHPVHLFHVPITGVGITIADLFALGQAETDASVGIDYYDWEFLQPLHEGEEYSMTGGVTEYAREKTDQGRIVDAVTFNIELTRGDGELVARVAFRWYFRRSQA